MVITFIKAKTKYLQRFIATTTLTLLALLAANAQHVSVTAKLDSMLIFIGGQINLTLEVNQPIGTKVNFPLLVDTLSQSIEIVEAGKIDTLPADNQRLLLTQVYRITSFDSGVHLVPPIKFEIADAQSQEILQTQSMALKVVNPFESVDPEKGIYDIKQPVNTPFKLSELLPYLPYILLFIAVIAAIVLFVIWRFNRKLLQPFAYKEKVIEPPHVIALRELERIKNEKAWQKGQVKLFYIQITDVLRQYIEVRFNLPAMEQTSDETLKSLKKEDVVDGESLKNLKQLLITADLVKFAKMQPLPDENDLNLIHAIFFVNQTKFEEQKTLEEEKLVLEKNTTTEDQPFKR